MSDDVVGPFAVMAVDAMAFYAMSQLCRGAAKGVSPRQPVCLALLQRGHGFVFAIHYKWVSAHATPSLCGSRQLASLCLAPLTLDASPVC